MSGFDTAAETVAFVQKFLRALWPFVSDIRRGRPFSREKFAALATAVGGLAVASGVLTPDDAEALSPAVGLISDIVQAFGALVVVVAYHFGAARDRIGSSP